MADLKDSEQWKNLRKNGGLRLDMKDFMKCQILEKWQESKVIIVEKDT
jgi:hypothetical protein